MGQLSQGRMLPAMQGFQGSAPAFLWVRAWARAAGARGAKPCVGPWHSPLPCLSLSSSQEGFGSLSLFPWNLPLRFPLFILSGSIWFNLTLVRCRSLRGGMAAAVPAVAPAISHWPPHPPCSSPHPLSRHKQHLGVQVPTPPDPGGHWASLLQALPLLHNFPAPRQPWERPEPQTPLIRDV